MRAANIIVKIPNPISPTIDTSSSSFSIPPLVSSQRAAVVAGITATAISAWVFAAIMLYRKLWIPVPPILSYWPQRKNCFSNFWNKKGYYVDLANDQALVKYQYFWSCQSWDNDASNRHFWGNHLSWAVLDILYQVLHIFYRVFLVMRQRQKI